MTTVFSNDSSWRDSKSRKNLNDNKSGTILNAIQSTDFKNNIMPVLKITNNDNTNNDNSNASSITTDKLFILSPSEMGMPIIRNYDIIDNNGNYPDYQYYHYNYPNVHYYDSNSYMNTIKSRSDYTRTWYSHYNYLYDGNTYKWWMLPAGTQISYGKQAYHNTDLYSYYALATSSNPSTIEHDYQSYLHDSSYSNEYWLRSTSESWTFATYIEYGYSAGLSHSGTYYDSGVVIAFSF